MPDEPWQTFESGEQAFLLAKAIVDTVREPLLVLDEDLQIVVASRSFYRTFEMTRPATQGHKIYDLDDGLWDIPELRLLLEKIVPEHEVMEGFEALRRPAMQEQHAGRSAGKEVGRRRCGRAQGGSSAPAPPARSPSQEGRARRSPDLARRPSLDE